MKTSKELLASLSQTALMPQEEMLEIGRKKGKLFIGIPKEISFQENRVALVPDAVALLVNNGHQIIVETNAGKMANFQDHDYSEAGAQIVYSAEEVYKADIILKVAPPSPQEIEMMQQKQTLISALQLTVQPEDFINSCLRNESQRWLSTGSKTLTESIQLSVLWARSPAEPQFLSLPSI